MKNPLFYLCVFAVCLFCATPAKAKNLTPDFSEATVTDEEIDNTSPRQVLQRREPPQRTGSPNPSLYKGEGSVDASQRGVKPTNATSDQTNYDSLSLEERLKSLPINKASRADLRERLIEYREAVKSRKPLSKPLSYKERGLNPPSLAGKGVGGLGLPDEERALDSPPSL